ncbi:phosphate signaling complex PhoU family protein [Mycobacterium sp.]|uniref:phosphate signaling complex PhoU family protein n=1 Tax=Mycobacterium sp. TaxID=1785 RepID=UPI003F9A9D5D
MREAGTQELGGLTAPLVDLIRLTSTAMSHATAALFSIDPAAAESIAAAYETVSALRRELEDHAAVLLALRAQSRVPELPVTIAAVHVNAEAERMGQLAREVADIARTRRAWASIPAPLLGVLRELSEGCLDTAAKAADVVESHTTIGVAELTRGDDNMNRLRHLLYQQLLSNSGVIDVDAAIDLTLAARCYERFAEHAKAVAHRGALLAVGAPRG